MGSNFINILNVQTIKTALESLSEKDQPVFGVMDPEQMVQRLIDSVDLSINKLQPLELTEKVDVNRAREFLFSDFEIKPGAKAPFISRSLKSNHKTSLTETRITLIERLKEFKRYFEQNPGCKTDHPIFGMLNFQEWVRFHNKHFTHHFKQYGIFPSG